MRSTMNRSRCGFRFGHAVVAASFLILPPAQLRAQGSVYAAGSVSWGPGTLASGGNRCGTTGTALVPGNSASANCNGGPNFAGFPGGFGTYQSNFLIQTGATANAGSLGSYSNVSWMVQRSDLNVSTFPATDAGANAIARWDDVAHFAPTTPGGSSVLKFLDITFRVHGNITGAEGLNYYNTALAGTSYIGNANSGVAFGGSSQGSSFFSSQVLKIGGIKQTMPNIPQFQTLRIGINGLVSNPFQYLLSTDAGVSIFGNYSSTDVFTGIMDAAFANTITPISYNLWDANDNDVTGQYGVSFENGLASESQQSVVPEPATVAMMGVGLLALFAVSTRRRKRSA